MLAVRITGGLGNQMFQYACARVIAEKNNVPLYLDISLFDKLIPNVDQRNFELSLFPNINCHFINKAEVDKFYNENIWLIRILRFFKFPTKKIFHEESHRFDKSIYEYCLPLLIDGYFQSERYFENHADLIKHEFSFDENTASEGNEKIIDDIVSNTSVAVHVRRGDYVKYAPTNSFHGVCSSQYYFKAINYFRDRIPDCKFYFFSDDPDWVNSNLLLEGINGSIIENNRGAHSWKDMFLMSKCNHHIIANSSFSWWGAWLCNNSKKMIIAPEKWFRTTDPLFEPNDIVPEKWMKMNNL